MQRHRVLAVVLLLTLLGGTAARASSIYVMSSGNAVFDANLLTVLGTLGHTATLGVEYTQFDGSQSLAGHGVVYMQVNYNWSSGTSNTPTAGQTALVNFVNGGGGLVSTEWLLWRAAQPGYFTLLDSLLPVAPTTTFTSDGSVRFTQVTPDPVINAGLAPSFVMPLQNISGTRTLGTARPGATTFYSMDGGYAGLAGWGVGSGRVLSFTTTNGQAQLDDANFQRLLGNVFTYAAGEATGTPVPEPASLLLLGAGLVGLRARRKR